MNRLRGASTSAMSMTDAYKENRLVSMANALTRIFCRHTDSQLYKVSRNRLHLECMACGAMTPGIDVKKS